MFRFLLLLNLLVKQRNFSRHPLIVCFVLLYFLLLLFKMLVHFVLKCFDVVFQLLVCAKPALVNLGINLSLLLCIEGLLIEFINWF